MIRIVFIVVFISAFAGLSSCSSAKEKKSQDRFDKGVIYISADESFKPIVDLQVKSYEAKYPNTRLIVQYKSEAECIKDLSIDSTRMIIITRKYSKEEERYMLDSLKVAPIQIILAYDAIALIVSSTAKDSLFTQEEVRDILKGKFKKNLIPVFDGLSATSTVRYMIDSVLRGDPLTATARAAKNSEDVINYVAKNSNTIGFVGISWIGNKEDVQQISFLTKVKLAKIESKDLAAKFIQPVQANIYEGRYPMTRELVCILKENHKNGLGHGFKNFMAGEQGQLIFRRAYLVPGQRQFMVRRATLRDE